MSSIRNQVTFEHYAGRIEVTHFEESMVYVTFSGLQGHKPPSSTLDPQLQGLGDDTQFQGPLSELYLLDSDADDLPGNLETYIKKTAPFFYERETSEFMRPTLLLAAELSTQKKVNRPFLWTCVRPKLMFAGHFAGTGAGIVGCNPHPGRLRVALEDILQPDSPPYLDALPCAALGRRAYADRRSQQL